MKNLLIFIAGAIFGVIVTFGALYLYSNTQAEDDAIVYYERPKSYENKKKTKFQVFQVFEDAALARESDELDMYLGTTVLLLGDDFYTKQVVEVKSPQIIGTYSYESKGGNPLTVPVITEQTSNE